MNEELKPYILIKVTRAEAYEDCDPEIVYDDFLRSAEQWESEIYEPGCERCSLFREKCPETWVDSIGNVEHICDVKGIKFCSFFEGSNHE